MKRSSYPEQEYRAVESVQDVHWWFQGRKRLISHFLKSAVKGKGSYIEIGCGTGYLLDILQSLPGIAISGIDMHEESIKIAKKRCGAARVFKATVEELGEVLFDTIGVFDVLEHIEDDKDVIKQLSKHLKLGGYMLITVPQHQWLFSDADQAAGHFRRYSRKKLRELLVDAGFKVIFSTSFVSFLLPAMWFKRVFQQSRSDNVFSWEDELKVGRFANRVLSMTSFLEYLLVRLGVSFPVGGSLFLLCRKAS